MTLSLSSNFTYQFGKANCEPVLVCQIYTDTVAPTIFCTGDRPIEFSAIYNPFTDANITGKKAPNNIANITAINTSIDPFERTCQRANITITVHDDGMLRALTASTRIIGQYLSIRLGNHNMASEPDWAPVFKGVVRDFLPREGSIDIIAEDAFAYIATRPFYGDWWNKHPLEVIKLILDESDTPSGLINATAFDPDSGDHTAIGHFNCTLARDLHRARWTPQSSTDGTQATMEWDDGESLDPIDTINKLSAMCVGSTYADEEGKITFVRFDSSAAAAANWGTDDIGGFKQTTNSQHLVNEIQIKTLDDSQNFSPWVVIDNIFIAKDASGQTNYAFPGASKHVAAKALNWDILQNFQHLKHDSLLSSTGAGGTFVVHHMLGMSGARDGFPSASQVANAKISGSKLLYLKIGKEIISVNAVAWDDDFVCFGGIHSNDNEDEDNPVAAAGPGAAVLTIAARGVSNTSAATYAGHHPCHDVTIPYYFCNTQIQRFAEGLKMVEVTTDLSQYKMQIGDLVTLTNDVFLSYGANGLTTSTKWEIVGKELQIDDNTCQVRWTLAWATEASYSAPTVTFDGWAIDRPNMRADWAKGIANQKAEQAHASEGLAVTATSGLGISIAAGACGVNGIDIEKRLAFAPNVTASKDTYVGIDVITGYPIFSRVSTGASPPIQRPSEIRLAKVVASSGVDSVLDVRVTAPIGIGQLDKQAIQAGHNLVYNPRFDRWSRGPGVIADGWSLEAGTINSSVLINPTAATLRNGPYSVKMTTANDEIRSEYIPVVPGESYVFEAWYRASSTAPTVAAGVLWANTDRSSTTTTTILNKTATGADTWYISQALTVAPSSRAWAQIFLKRTGSSTGDVFFDEVRLQRTIPVFRAFRDSSAQTIADGAAAVLQFNNTSTGGGHFDTSNYRFDAPVDGVYEFYSRVYGAGTHSATNSNIRIRKGGTAVAYGQADHGSAASVKFSVFSGPLELVTGDQIDVYITNASGVTLSFTNASESNYFFGRRIE